MYVRKLGVLQGSIIYIALVIETPSQGISLSRVQGPREYASVWVIVTSLCRPTSLFSYGRASSSRTMADIQIFGPYNANHSSVGELWKKSTCNDASVKPDGNCLRQGGND